MIVYALQKNTATGLQHQHQKYGNLIECLIEKVMQIIVICFGLMVNVDTAI
jgi:hypothetical protein